MNHSKCPPTEMKTIFRTISRNATKTTKLLGFIHTFFLCCTSKKDLIMMLKISTLPSTGILLHFFTCLHPTSTLQFSKGLECLMKYYLTCKYFPVNVKLVHVNIWPAPDNEDKHRALMFTFRSSILLFGKLLMISTF